MSAHENIQFLFSVISIAKLTQYLETQGWQAAESPSTERLYFDRTSSESAETATVWTWATESHLKYRRQLPNVIFALSCLENRPGLEIANEIYAIPVEASADVAQAAEAAGPRGGSSPTPLLPLQRCVLRFDRRTAIFCMQEVDSQVINVEAGVAIELAYDGSCGDILDLEFANDVLRVRIAKRANLRVLHGIADRLAGR